jgi:hypothetical protein
MSDISEKIPGVGSDISEAGYLESAPVPYSTVHGEPIQPGTRETCAY